ncbi:UvrD-helicase domain-containing protein [Citrobacter freundii]|uniref:UvrD-helicase domain-containing protein n=1 Tax=Citrobacter freundii TaxID=546 RepID=UPI002B2420B6|nr:UvrD-helicase domain-containing protein [Citrobacter freundii]MEB2474248.1 UvrD-helicase domain-containing protein [Citrobacter freundii]
MNVNQILTSERGSVVAPAGCGKTQLIIAALNNPHGKPILVLTHTTAGVAALKKRLRKFKVANQNFVVTTIDGWALRVAHHFAASCPMHSSAENPKLFYPEMRRVVNSFVASGALSKILKASYSRLYVDEYQDCNMDQHRLIVSLSNQLPTVVFGDPMQCIFDFSGAMPDWVSEVEQQFPSLGTLTTPWRWNNANSPILGEWILQARDILMSGEKVDLSSCPQHIFWHPLSGDYQTDRSSNYKVERSILELYPNDSLLVIGASMDEQSRHSYAQGNPRIDVVEQIQLSGIITAAQEFDEKKGKSLADSIVDNVSKMITNVDAAVTKRRIDTILNGRNEKPATECEQALCDVVSSNSRSSILSALLQLEKKDGARVYRKAAFKALKDTISMSISSPQKSMFESASIIRERLRQVGDNRIPKRAIGSTLLLKGLEADHCLILNAQNRGMNARHLYVALSRGAKSVSIFSTHQYIG